MCKITDCVVYSWIKVVVHSGSCEELALSKINWSAPKMRRVERNKYFSNKNRSCRMNVVEHILRQPADHCSYRVKTIEN